MTTKDESGPEGFTTVPQFADSLSVSIERVQSWIRRGELPAVRLGRLTFIPEDALQRMLDRREEQHADS